VAGLIIRAFGRSSPEPDPGWRSARRRQGRFTPLRGDLRPALTATARSVSGQSGRDEETALSAEQRNRLYLLLDRRVVSLPCQAVCASCFRTPRALAFSRTSSLRASVMRTAFGGFPAVRSVS
jgi:hypothetical protein